MTCTTRFLLAVVPLAAAAAPAGAFFPHHPCGIHYVKVPVTRGGWQPLFGVGVAAPGAVVPGGVQSHGYVQSPGYVQGYVQSPGYVQSYVQSPGYVQSYVQPPVTTQGYIQTPGYVQGYVQSPAPGGVQQPGGVPMPGAYVPTPGGAGGAAPPAGGAGQCAATTVNGKLDDIYELLKAIAAKTPGVTIPKPKTFAAVPVPDQQERDRAEARRLLVSAGDKLAAGKAAAAADAADLKRLTAQVEAQQSGWTAPRGGETKVAGK